MFAEITPAGAGYELRSHVRDGWFRRLASRLPCPGVAAPSREQVRGPLRKITLAGRTRATPADGVAPAGAGAGSGSGFLPGTRALIFSRDQKRDGVSRKLVIRVWM